MKNAIWIIVVLVALGALGYWYYRKQSRAATAKPAGPLVDAAGDGVATSGTSSK